VNSLLTLKPPYVLLSVKFYITAGIIGETGLTPSTQSLKKMTNDYMEDEEEVINLHDMIH
jgi:hypothetical protein